MAPSAKRIPLPVDSLIFVAKTKTLKAKPEKFLRLIQVHAFFNTLLSLDGQPSPPLNDSQIPCFR